jgi:hypothetical protein
MNAHYDGKTERNEGYIGEMILEFCLAAQIAD